MDNEEDKAENPDDDKDILEDCRKYLQECITDEEPERRKMMDDLRFGTLDQWPSDIRKLREDQNQEGGPRPCLTIDKINQYIMQVVNDMRQGKPGINVRPQDDEADIETAKILKGLVRNIEDQSKADIAYATGGESAARIGLGFWRVTTEYVSDDSFDQEIFIKPLPNTFAVYLGRHIMPDGSDAKRGFIIETMAVDKFKEHYPKAKYKSTDFEDLGEHLAYWHTGETVTVVEYFRLHNTSQTLLFLADGSTITEKDYDKWPEKAGAKPTIQDRRTTFKEQLKWVKVTGVEVLEKRSLPGKYIPIVECIGRESHVEGKRILWGLIRPAKDSLRMYNYFASKITEKMGLIPNTPFVGAKGQFENMEDKWRKSNQINYSYLEYNPIDVNGNVVPAPKRQEASEMEAAYFHFMQVIEHDVQTGLGMFKAAVGETESQQSGRALLALQKESDTGTYHFAANQGIAIRHTGAIIVDLIPHYYDTKRILRIIGEDGELSTVTIDPDQPQAHQQIQTAEGIKSIHNPGVGKYDVSISVGPSYATKRQESAATFVEMSKGSADPSSAAVLRYLVMRNSDSAGADEAAKLLKTLLPPQALQALASKQPIPPEVQAEVQKMQQQMQMMQEEGAKLKEENVQLKAGAQVGMAKIQAESEAKKAIHELNVAQANDTHNLAIQSAKEEADLTVWKAKLDATTKIEVAQIAAKTSLTETAIQAETDANIALSTALREDGTEGKPEPLTPLNKIISLHQQALDQNAGSTSEISKVLAGLSGCMQQLVTLTQQNLEASKAPHQITLGSIRTDSKGMPVGATVTKRPTVN